MATESDSDDMRSFMQQPGTECCGHQLAATFVHAFWLRHYGQEVQISGLVHASDDHCLLLVMNGLKDTIQFLIPP